MARNARRVAIVAVGMTLGLALSGCVGSTPSAPPGTPLSTSPPTTAQLRTPAQMLTASDGATNDYFGGAYWFNTFVKPIVGIYYASPGETSMSSNGKFAVVGAPGHWQDGAVGAGAVYVFAETNGRWRQVAELALAGHQPYEGFGWSVAISDDGSTVVAGAPYHASVGKVGDGGAYVFHRSGGTWTETAQLRPPDLASYDSLGWSVAISGAKAPYTVLVGAPSRNLGTVENVGAAYAFRGSVGNWSSVGELSAPEASPEAEFGTAVALSADSTTALVTRFDHDDKNKVHRVGALYVFKTTDGWASAKVAQRFQDPNINPERTPDAYGTEVGFSADGHTAIVAVPDQTVAKVPGAGVICVYTTASNWTSADSHAITIAEPKPQANSYYGSSVEIDEHGEVAVVGADGAGNNDEGALYLLRASSSKPPSRWNAESVKHTLIVPAQLKGIARLGTDVGMSLDGKTIIGSAPLLDVDGKTHQGAAFVVTEP